MLVLDTDHLSHFDQASPAGERLRQRLVTAGEEVAATIVSAEEQLRGWLTQIHKAHADPHAAIPAYERLQRRLEFYASWLVLGWESAVADLFLEMRKRGVRIGPMDLKIACIATTRNAVLLTRNKNDFSRVPGLLFENWLDS